MSRVRNCAVASDLEPIVRKLYREADVMVPSDATFADVAGRHAEFLEKLLALTPRPVVSMLKDGLGAAFPDLSVTVKGSFAQMLVDCISHHRVIARSTSTGEKLEPGQRRLVKAIGTYCRTPPAKRLRRKTSDESSQVVEVPRQLKKQDSVFSVASTVSEAPPPVPDSMAGILGSGNTLEQKQYIFGNFVDNELETYGKSFGLSVWKRVLWSLWFAFLGQWPTVDPNTKLPYPPDTPEGRKAGKPLADGCSWWCGTSSLT